MEFSVEIGVLERAGRSKSRPLDGVFVAIAAFETGPLGRHPSFRAWKPEDRMRRAK
jgi:hypothetical protein